MAQLDVEQYASFFVELGNVLAGREKWEMGLMLFAKINENENVGDRLQLRVISLFLLLFFSR